MNDTLKFEPGAVFAEKFTIIEFLRKDYAGTDIYLAEDSERQEKVMIRVLSPDMNKDDLTPVQRLIRSFELAGSLEHPSILPAYEYGVESDNYFFVTGYIEGAYLDDYLQTGQVVMEEDTASIAISIADALEYAWNEVKMIYRDLKPETILINEEAVPVLTDFGLAKSANKDTKGKGVTLAGSMVGNPQYMSPEQIYSNQVLDCRSDIYCLGLVLYRMLAGCPAFEGKVPMVLIEAQLNRQHTPVIKINTDVSPACSAIIDRMLAKAREDRQSNWTAVKADFTALLNGETPPSLTETDDHKNTKWIKKFINPES